MAAPTFVASYTSGEITASPTTVSVTAAVGDLLLVFGMPADSARTMSTPTGGTGITWTLLTSSVGFASFGNMYVWSGTATTAQTFTLSATSNTTGPSIDILVERWSGHGGTGTFGVGHAANAAPSLALTTTGANSGISVANIDWVPVSGASRVWRTTAGALTEDLYLLGSGGAYYGGHHPDVGAAGAKTVGLSAPTGQSYNIAAVEVLGTATAAATPPRAPRVVNRAARIRSAHF